MLNWQRQSEYALKATEAQGVEWIISKANVEGKAIYCLWRNMDYAGKYASAQEAKDHAEAMRGDRT